MKRWLVFLVAVAAIACVVMGVHIVREKRALRELAQREREVAYQAALRSYSDVITPGMTRKEGFATRRISISLSSLGALRHMNGNREPKLPIG